MELSKISYSKLNARQKENYNFHKIASILADYGFTSIRLTDDWQGADFIAAHIDGKNFIKIQLKGRLIFLKKYIGKDIWIAFRDNKMNWFLYPHDKLSNELEKILNFKNTDSWKKGGYSWPRPSKRILECLEKHKL